MVSKQTLMNSLKKYSDILKPLPIIHISELDMRALKLDKVPLPTNVKSSLYIPPGEAYELKI